MLWITLLSFIGVGALFVALAQPLIARRIKPNDLYGVRTPKTQSSESVWYDANEYGGRILRQVGIGVIVAAIILLPFAWLLAGRIGTELAASCYGLTCALLLFGAVLWMAVVILKRVREL